MAAVAVAVVEVVAVVAAVVVCDNKATKAGIGICDFAWVWQQ